MGCTLTSITNEVNVTIPPRGTSNVGSTNRRISSTVHPRGTSVAGAPHSAISSDRDADVKDPESTPLRRVAKHNRQFEAKSMSSSVSNRTSSQCEYDWIPENLWIDPADFSAMYFIQTSGKTRRLGKGSTCSVYRGLKKRCWVVSTDQCKRSNLECAIKKVDIPRPKKIRSVRREVSVLADCQHENIVRLEGVSVGKDCFYLVMPLYRGGSVIDLLKDCQGLGELEVRRMTIQLLNAVQYLHNRGIVHRDIKPDNMVFEDEDLSRLILIDFGSARRIADMDEKVDWAGTPAYMAPEMMRETRSRDDCKAVDMWAIGVTVYVMLTSCLPFFGRNIHGLIKEVCTKKLTWPRRGSAISLEAKHFVQMLTNKNNRHRMNVDIAMQHAWILGSA